MLYDLYFITIILTFGIRKPARHPERYYCLFAAWRVFHLDQPEIFTSRTIDHLIQNEESIPGEGKRTHSATFPYVLAADRDLKVSFWLHFHCLNSDSCFLMETD